MRKLVLTCFAAGLYISSGYAQTLFTYGNNPVSKKDFLRVYEKNSLNKKPDYSETALREYLDLYSLFRMKVKEAELQQLDTLPSIQRELDNYRKQLAKNYLTDEQVTDKLIHEAYDRLKEEVHVAHILISVPPSANPADTLAAYHKIDSLYNLVTKKKADFGELAKQFSDDRGSKDRGGDIGYMTSLQVVYPFESAAYNTSVGKISAPFRTQFGYHILKVIDRRQAKGEVQVAQILISSPKSKGAEGIEASRKRADSVMAQLKKGADFSELVKKYSDDKFSVAENGVLQPFGVGRMVPAFEDAAFSMKKPGDLSGPVQTDYGFHILKLIRKIPLRPYDSIATTIKHKIDNDSRSQMARDIFFDKIKQKNGFKEYPENLKAVVDKIVALPDTGKTAGLFTAAKFSSMNQPVFTLSGKNYLQSDFVSFAEGLTRGQIRGPRVAVMGDIYKMYVNRVVNDFEEHHLVDENEDFKNLMEEYSNGIMLFELMDRNVWGKASRDSVGLKAFYEKNKGRYTWDPGFTGAVYRFKDEAALKAGQKALAKKNVTDEDLIKELNSEKAPDAVSVQHGHYEFTRFKDVPQSAIVKGKLSEPVKNADGSYTVVKADDVFNAPTPKSLDDARGYAISEYQDYLSKQWDAQLRQKYSVKVDEGVFKTMVK
ncbi:peptidylprolyl isomerase [Chitinophagaceae bacterium MMS25-I14]